MERQEILEKIKPIIVEVLVVEEDDVTEDAVFKDDLHADSLAMVELVVGLEDEFGIHIEEEASDQIKTVGDAVTYIEENV